jgi:hypothetical protein
MTMAAKKRKREVSVSYELDDTQDGQLLAQFSSRADALSFARDWGNVRVVKVTREVVLEVKP